MKIWLKIKSKRVELDGIRNEFKTSAFSFWFIMRNASAMQGKAYARKRLN